MFTKIVQRAGNHHWHLVANALYPDEKPFIDWLKFLPEGVGTKNQRAYLIRSAKGFLVALINMPSAKRHHALSHATVLNWTRWMRRLARWMIAKEVWRFSQLNEERILQFIEERSFSIGGDGRALRDGGRTYKILLEWMWILRHDYVGSLRTNPATLEYELSLRCPLPKRVPWRAIDESLALPLIHDAIQWIKVHGPFVLEAVATCYRTLARCVGLTKCQIHLQLKRTYAQLDLDPRMRALRLAAGTGSSHAFIVLRNALTQTEGACLIAMLFLVGFRCSELVRLDVDAVTLDTSSDGQAIFRLKGIAAKKNGFARTWVASEPVLEVVDYLKNLYASARQATGQKALFLSRAGGSAPQPGHKIKRLSTVAVAKRIKMFANSVHRPEALRIKGLHPHAARKTFARFVVMRDKRALEALSYHYGHTHRLFTDSNYVGADIQLEKLIGEENRRDLAAGLIDILQSTAIAGKASKTLQGLKEGVSVPTGYRGQRSLQSVVERLIDQGVQLAPCDWGYCVYSQTLSACRGTEQGPNEAYRSPEVCSGCANFVVTEKHRAWWNGRVERDREYLSLQGIPDQSRQWVKKRMVGTVKILKDLDARPE